ncbi:MAG: U32 family peptidase [Lachnospiraceae bacterium]|nr:U32 family peptidase [Lachnospiraceae bacterium]
MKHPELLIPANSPEVFKVAVRYGADAIYIGGEAFSLRAKATNFNSEEMAEAVRYAHEHGVRVHVTANILAHNADLAAAEDYFRELEEIGPDAVLIADPGMFRLARRHLKRPEIHISTQANNTNYETCNFWYDMGASRVVMARELSLTEIRQIREKTDPGLEIEAFIHGAMCISYSGRCLLSNYFTGRDANHGACTHPCRWQYAVAEMSRPGQYLPIEETERGTFIFNSKDLCMVDHLPDLYEAGVDSFKIEGRMKTALYVASAARTYSCAMRRLEESREAYDAGLDWCRSQIADCTYRDFTTGFFYGKPDESAQIYGSNTYMKGSTYLGVAEESTGDRIVLHQKNKFSVGETIEFMKPDGTDVRARVTKILNHEGLSVESAPHPKERVEVFLELLTEGQPESGDIIRRREA